MKRSLRLLVALALIFAFTGLLVPDYRVAVLPLGALGYVSIRIVSPVLIYLWCQADIAERKLPYPAGIPLIVGGLGPLGVPVYLFWTRSPASAFIGLGQAVAFAAVCVCLFAGGAYVHGYLFA